MTRLEKLRKRAFEEGGFDGYLVFNAANQLYFLGFPGTAAVFVPLEGECVVYVYEVNFEQAKAQGSGFCVEKVRSGENLMDKIAAGATQKATRSLAVDGLGVQSWKTLARAFRGKAKLKADSSQIAALRMVKDREEIALMRRAGELTSIGMEAAYCAVEPGAKEFEVAAEIEYAMRTHGSGPTAFESIVASGSCSAFPHGGCSCREIRSGDLVVVDIGATYNYYCSDMTRTMVAGKPSEKQNKIFETVRNAQQKAFEAAQPGVPVAELDATARQIIANAGFGDFFVHRLGHGVGLEVHEPPSIGVEGKEKLTTGNVVTDEPGIYIPGFGGVRIEDTVLITSNGSERLTSGPYSLTKMS